MDEISPFQKTDEQFDSLMEGMLDDCTNLYLRSIPVHLIVKKELLLLNANSPSRNFERGIANHHDLGIVLLPDGFLRLAYVACYEWHAPIVSADDVMTVNDKEYGRQFNQHTKAGLAKPMVFIDTVDVSKKRLIISPFRDHWGINVLSVYYVSETKPEKLQENLLDGFYWFFASHVLDAMQRYEQGKMAMGKFGEIVSEK